MINSTPISAIFNPPPVSKKEILRYMGCKTPDDDTDALIDRTLRLCLDKTVYRVVSAEYEISVYSDSVDIGNVHIESKDLAKNLADCSSAVIFGATVGIEYDRLINKYGKSSPSLALCIQALGAERIEALCDSFCHSLAEKFAQSGNTVKPRFSAGYGDLSIFVQRDIFRLLSCEKNIGLSLCDSLLMSPSKSVTAIVGIK